MTRTRRVAPVLATAALCLASAGAPSVAEGTRQWTKSACKLYAKEYAKRHPHRTKAQKSKANKVLRSHGCSLRIH